MPLSTLLLLCASFAMAMTMNGGLREDVIVFPSHRLALTLGGFLAFLVVTLLDQFKQRRVQLAGFVIIALVLGMNLIVIGRAQVVIREQTSPPAYRNDGVTQTVEAARFLLRGINPYDADFGVTTFSAWPSPKSPLQRNLAFDHYAYPPLPFLLFTPFVWLADQGIASVDYESIYLAIFVFCCLALTLLAKTWETRAVVVILTLGNPFIWILAMQGFNDLLPTLCILLFTSTLLRRHWRIAGVLLALALAAKQSAWLLLPPIVFWLIALYQNRQVQYRDLQRMMVAGSITLAVTFLPFIIWSPSAIIDDVIRYVGGAYPDTFPIAGVTILQYLHVFHLVSSPWTNLPLWPIFVAALLPTYWWLYRVLIKAPRPQSLFLGMAVTLTTATIFNRTGAENYFLPPIMYAIASYISAQSQHIQGKSPNHE